MTDCEVRDWTLTSTSETLELRMLNEAANVELRRRGQPELTGDSGELLGDAIVWIPEPSACGTGWIEPGTL